MTDQTHDMVEAMHLLAKHGTDAVRDVVRSHWRAAERHDSRSAQRWERIEALVSRRC